MRQSGECEIHDALTGRHPTLGRRRSGAGALPSHLLE